MSIFSGVEGDDSQITSVTRYGPEGAQAAGRPEGSVMTVAFRLHGQDVVALNGGPQFPFTEAVSLVVNCETQEEVDRFWEGLSEGGEEGPCGWLKDRFGLSWQVTPTFLTETLADADPARSERVMAAMLGRRRLTSKPCSMPTTRPDDGRVTMAEVKFNSVLIGTEHPDTLGEFYTTVFDRPADMKDGGWYGWGFGGAWLSIGAHSEVKGQATEPQRLILNIETTDVQGEFARIQASGAKVIREPYEFQGMWLSTFADPDGNYFQLVSPMEGSAPS